MFSSKEIDDQIIDDSASVLPDFTGQTQIGDVLQEVALCTFTANPDDMRFCFSTGMVGVIGKEASQPMLIDAFAQYIPEEDRQRAVSEYQAAYELLMSGKKSVSSLKHAIRKSSVEIVWIKVYMQKVNTIAGERIFGLVLDQTQTMYERLLSQLFSDGISEFIFYYDTVTDIVYVNSHLKNVLELPNHYIESASEEVIEFIHPDDQSKFLNIVEGLIQNNSEHTSVDFRLLSPSRGEVWVHSCGVSNYDIMGSDRFLTGLLIDVTERRKADFLQKSIIEGTSAIVFTADIKRSTISFSENLRQLFPDVPLEVDGDLIEFISDHIIPEDRARFREPIERMIAGDTDRYSVEFRINKPNGRFVWLASRGKAFYDSGKQSQMIVGTIFDLSSMNEVRELVEKTGYLHEVSGLPTRERLIGDIEKVISDRNVLSAAVILVDIRGFHTYNDRFGRETGDDILHDLGKTLLDGLPSGASLYHIGIDLFCVLWPHATRIQAECFMEQIQEEADRPLIIGGDSIYVSFSMSSALFPSCGSTAEELVVNAEITLHKVKQNSRKKHAIYCPTDKRELKERLDFEFQLSKAIRSGKESFRIFYQPLVRAESEKVVGAEALLRWNLPGKEDVRPEKVIAVLEATGQMEQVGSWILERVIRQCSAWLKAGADPDFFVHVNITAEDLARPNYSDFVVKLIRKYSVRPHNIVLEITETSLMRSILTCRQNLIRLRNAGLRIAIDDFGTGYSSLNYLRELPIDEVKIDRAFIEDIRNDRFNRSFISAIILLSHSISKEVCVEGVDSIEKVRAATEMKADYLQGFYYGRAADPKKFESEFLGPDKRHLHNRMKETGEKGGETGTL
ncbi:MAG: EAL domain-containing protein [Clostridiales bacterium]|nr:EAL domain-containing protein [Clostridiales bacterium]